jgi:hypothetical protein
VSNLAPRPELVVKFWPPSITAKGVEAIEAIRRPMAFAVYTRPIFGVILAIGVLLGGHEYLPWALRLLKFW